jgi:hypothetical protein
MADPALFGAWFTPPQSWAAWRAYLAAVFALPMTEAETAIYRQHTGRSTLPTSPAREAWLVAGRRGGKSIIAALIGVYLACFRDYRAVLKPGERGTVMILAADRDQARVVLGYVQAFLEVPMLARMVERRTAEAIALTNRTRIEVHTASYRSVRGYTIVAAICDEIAFWMTGEDSLNPDREIVTALRPAMATLAAIGEGLLLGISSPYARAGVLWENYRAHYGQDGDPVLVWQADTRAMNPSIPEAFIASEYAKDPAAAKAEYGAEFRTDLEAFLSRELVECCVVPGRHRLPPIPGVHYTAFVDPSGGVGDSMTLGIAHREGERVILDLLHERRAPLSPEATVAEFVEIAKPYRVHEVTGDRYSEEFVREHFRSRGLAYTVSDRDRSALYVETLPLLTSGRAQLLDDARLIAQLVSLERRTGGSGKDAITHPRNQHDDVANAAAGCLVHAAAWGDQLMFADLGDQARREKAGDLPAWMCPTCRGDKRADGRCPRCEQARCSVGHLMDPNGRCWTCQPGPTLRDLGLGW